jgi:LysM repeat protein
MSKIIIPICLFVFSFANNQHINRHKKQAFPTDSTRVHIIKKGETLYSIANKYGISVAEIKQWNHLASNTIQIGEKLRIYPHSQKERTSVASRPSDHPSKKSRYTVKEGDTLFRIAQLFQTSVKDLETLNHLTSNTIRIGQKLKVRPAAGGAPAMAASSMKYGKFTRYTLRKTQSLQALLAKFHMGESEFYALNPGVDTSSFHKGGQIEVLMPANASQKNPYRVKNASKKLGIVTATKYKPDAFGPTTDGELYNPEALTAGSPFLKIGTIIFLKNKRNGRGAFVRINDRTTGKEIKLSRAAWDALGLTDSSRKVMAYHIHE